MRQKPIDISEAELEVMKVLWERGPCTVRDVLDVFHQRQRTVAYNTVLTLLQRLVGKGQVAVDKGKSVHVFAAAVQREGLIRRGLTTLADQLCDGTSAPLVLQLIADRQFTPEQIGQFRRLLDELESSVSGPEPSVELEP